jgi:hypothetical protein
MTDSRLNPRVRKVLLVIVILGALLGGVQFSHYRFDCGKEVVEYGDFKIEQVTTTTPYRDWKGNCHVAVRETKMDGDYQIRLASFYRVERGGSRVKVRGPNPLTIADCYGSHFRAFKFLKPRPLETKMKQFWNCWTNTVEAGNVRLRVRGDFISLQEAEGLVARKRRR